MSAQGLGSRAIIGSFYDRYVASPLIARVAAISMKFDSDQAAEEYKWLGSAPVMREWIAGRQAKGFRENGFTVANKKFEATLKVLVDEIRRDKTGQVMARVNEMADRAAGHELKLISDLILGAESGLCYDGQYFFDTDHVEGDSGSQSNIVTFDISDNGGGGTSTQPTARTMHDAIMAVIARILSFKDDQGEPMNETAAAFEVHVAPSLMAATMSAVGSDNLDAGQTNTLKNSKFKIDPVVNPRLATWTTKFAVFRTDGAVKPFIIQEEEALSISAIAEGSEHEFTNDEHLYGVKKIGNAAYGYWQHAAQGVLTA